MKLPVSEIFGPVIQGEGPVAGLPTLFVRFGGCDYRCSWCDSLHAVLPEHAKDWRPMAETDIMATLLDLWPHPVPAQPGVLVTLSGGNPALYDLSRLVGELRARGFTVACETQGSFAKPWFAALDWLIVSPKGPSSGNVTPPVEVAACMDMAGEANASVKIVVADEADYAYAVAMRHEIGAGNWYLQPLNNAPPPATPTIDGLMESYRWLCDRVLADRWYDVRVIPQIHVLAWGNERGR